MDAETKRKISLIHIAYGTVLGILFGKYAINVESFFAAMLIGFVISYPIYILTKKFFNTEFEIKEWIVSGYVYFFLSWILFWTLFYNFNIT